jgi:hypothetical protein
MLFAAPINVIENLDGKIAPKYIPRLTVDGQLGTFPPLQI